MNYDVVVIGGGPGGLAAALRAHELGLKVLLLDENEFLGGILPQCIHPGFGTVIFKKDYTGPEFASIFIHKIIEHKIPYKLNAHVLEIRNYSDMEKIVVYTSPEGVREVWTRTVIYAAGARERHQFEIGITGDRVSGVLTAGEAQTYMDLYGMLPGKNVLIVGSGDVGLIMARRFALEGATVKMVVEMMPYPGGLARNIMQCLNDFDIPLYLSHKVLEVRGRGRVERAKIVKIDENFKEIPGSEFWVDCDTVLISAGLVPKVKPLRNIGVRIDPRTGGPVVNEYFETSVPGVFAVGNSLVINDLVDHVVEQGELAAEGAAKFVKEGISSRRWIKISAGEGVRFVVPHYISGERDVFLNLRVQKPMDNVYVHLPEIGRKIKKLAVKPSEMLRIRLRQAQIKDVDEITVEVRK
ncbi:MAG: NAD(P)/FAD-dependent oxidoreductase [Euryarchaeota archaeon]|nr:NAD(P)/FAD-dependent oxidoreductase [Euryarchaeota archaeon]